MKNIVIATYFFYPEITPRAFRAFELAKEFVRKGHRVVILCPDKGFNYKEAENKFGFEVKTYSLGFFFNKQPKKSFFASFEKEAFQRGPGFEIIKTILRTLFLIPFVGGRDFESAYFLALKLLSLRKGFDLLLSIGLPFSTHFGCFLALMINPWIAKRTVADYGDPFSFNPQIKVLPHYKYVEKIVLIKFDYVTVPTKKALSAFVGLKNINGIRVIPQGYEFGGQRLANYYFQGMPRFAYAGLFYPGIRNPEVFFNFLLSLDLEFEMTIFTDTNNKRSYDCIEPFVSKLGKKLVVKESIPREECIFELSKFDFLLNIENVSNSQTPSKLIDYAITKRPVFSFSQDSFSGSGFMEFLAGDYSNDHLNNFDLNHFRIDLIAKQFLDL